MIYIVQLYNLRYTIMGLALCVNPRALKGRHAAQHEDRPPAPPLVHTVFVAPPRRSRTPLPAAPTQDDIENRLNAANTFRDSNIKAHNDKIESRLSSAKATKNDIDAKHVKNLSSQMEKLSTKMNTAENFVSKLTEEKVGALREHHGVVSSISNSTAQANEAQAMAIQADILRKQDKAAKARESVIASKVVAVSSHNEAVKVQHAGVLSKEEEKGRILKEKIERKMEVVGCNYQAVMLEKVLDVGKKGREGEERARLVREEREEKEKNVRAEREERERNVEERREAVLKERVEKSVKMKKEVSVTSTTSKEDIQEKLDEAGVRREAVLRERVAKSAKKGPRSPVKGGSPTTAAALQEKQDEASARREVLLQQRSEQCGMHSSYVKSVVKGMAGKERVIMDGKKLHYDEEVLPGAEVKEAVEVKEVQVEVAAVAAVAAVAEVEEVVQEQEAKKDEGCVVQ